MNDTNFSNIDLNINGAHRFQQQRLKTQSVKSKISPVFIVASSKGPKRLNNYHQKMIIIGVFDVVKLICKQNCSILRTLFVNFVPHLRPPCRLHE